MLPSSKYLHSFCNFLCVFDEKLSPAYIFRNDVVLEQWIKIESREFRVDGECREDSGG